MNVLYLPTILILEDTTFWNPSGDYVPQTFIMLAKDIVK